MIEIVQNVKKPAKALMCGRRKKKEGEISLARLCLTIEVIVPHIRIKIAFIGILFPVFFYYHLI